MINQLKYNRLLILYNELFSGENILYFIDGAIVYHKMSVFKWIVFNGIDGFIIHKGNIKQLEYFNKLPVDFIVKQLVKKCNNNPVIIRD